MTSPADGASMFFQLKSHKARISYKCQPLSIHCPLTSLFWCTYDIAGAITCFQLKSHKARNSYRPTNPSCAQEMSNTTQWQVSELGLGHG